MVQTLLLWRRCPVTGLIQSHSEDLELSPDRLNEVDFEDEIRDRPDIQYRDIYILI